MALIQVGIIAKRDKETGEFGPAMPICKEVDTSTPESKLFEANQRDLERRLAKKVREYLMNTK